MRETIILLLVFMAYQKSYCITPNFPKHFIFMQICQKFGAHQFSAFLKIPCVYSGGGNKF